ncbi:MAG: histidine phosphatase family protein [Lachnospiraceae bacterium]|nr:histidine phosphatase family protein [Lachnospiraceae bacterium]
MRTGTTYQIELLLLRHGATGSNEEGRYLGQTDESLSDAGKQELLRKKLNLSMKQPDLLFSGPMIRCQETAKLLFDTQPILIPEWTEMDFGDFEGKSYRELSGDPDYQAWIDSNGTLAFPGGESREEFIERSKKGLGRMLTKVREWEETNCPAGDLVRTAAVVHGGTIMALLSSLTGGEYFDFQVKCGEGYLVCLSADEQERPVLQDYKKT